MHYYSIFNYPLQQFPSQQVSQMLCDAYIILEMYF